MEEGSNSYSQAQSVRAIKLEDDNHNYYINKILSIE